MSEPAPPRRRTHGGTGAGALALVKPLPPQAVAARPGFTRAKRLRPQSPPADRWAVAQDDAFALRRRAGDAPPTRNSKEPIFENLEARILQPHRQSQKPALHVTESRGMTEDHL